MRLNIFIASALFMLCLGVIHAQPVADFSFNTGCTNPVIFTSLSTGNIVSWTWDFDDGGTSTFTNPSHSFPQAGSYDVTLIVRDNINRRDTVTKTVVFTDLRVSTTSDTNNICRGDSVMLSAHPTGGTMPYEYKWNIAGIDTTQTITHAPTGNANYRVTITDAAGCTVADTIPITVRAASVGISQPVYPCPNISTQLTANASSGVTSYVWSTGATTAAIMVAEPYASSISYSVTATFSNGCSATDVHDLIVLMPPRVHMIWSTLVICAGSTTATLEAAPYAVMGPYTYNWSTGANTAIIPMAPTVPTTYTVTVTASNGCTVSGSFTPILAPLPVSSLPANINVCTGQSISLTPTASSGTPPYTYSWSTGDNTETITVSPSGTTSYIVTVTDSWLCKTTDTATVTMQAGTSFTLTATGSSLACNNSCNGTAMATITGGTPPFTYTWLGTGVTTSSINSLCAGTHTVRATGSDGCSATKVVTIAAPLPLQVTATIYVACSATCTSRAHAAATGGTPPYTYTWSNVSFTGDSAWNLCNGQHRVTVSDGNGCVAIDTFTITQPSGALTVLLNPPFVKVLCPGDCNGNASAFAMGGTPPYNYAWSNGDLGTMTDSLCEGTYALSVTDSTGCTAVNPFTVDATSQISMLTVTKTDVTCNGVDDGTAFAQASGLGGASYLWSNNAITQTITNLAAGTYTVTATDIGFGCTATASVTIEDEGFSTLATSTNSTCGNADGTATVTASNGVAPYTYAWGTVPPQTAATAVNLSAGTYTVTITDNAGCTRTTQVSVSDAGAPLLSEVVQPATCVTAANGEIDITVSGNPPYTFMWSNGAATEDITGILPGVYSLSVTNAGSCLATRVVTVPVVRMTLTATTTDVSCSGGDGTATVTVSGATTPLTYAWSNGQTTQTATGLQPGGYSVTATDTFGCYRHVNVQVEYQPACIVQIGGTVYLDANTNCVQDSGEAGIPYMRVHVAPIGSVYTSASGFYSVSALPGTYTITQILPQSPRLGIVCPTGNTHTVTVSGGAFSLQNNFADTITQVRDLYVVLSCGIARPGRLQQITLSIYNHGDTPASGSADLVLDNSLTFDSGAQPDAQSGNTLTYNFSGIPSGGYMPIVVYARLSTSATIGTPVTNTVSVTPVAGDNTPSNNTASCFTNVIASYDPNMKEVEPAGTADGSITQTDTTMYYTIHFQNTGNDTAFTVVIKDTLDSNLDYYSFKQGTASHPYTVHFEGDDVAVFTFENIMLPDSNVNEAESHGQVSYYIEHDGVLPLATVISNRAAIYFDYNAPIITNTVISKIYDPTGVHELYSLSDNIKVYPNPAQDVITVEALNSYVFTQVYLTDMPGKRVYDSGKVNSRKHSIRLNNLSAGVYFITVRSANEVGVKKIIVE